LRQTVYKRLEGLEKISAAAARRAGLSPIAQQKLNDIWAESRHGMQFRQIENGLKISLLSSSGAECGS
jgi:hypothetical protein